MEQVHLHPTNADSQLQSRLHLCLELHPPQPVTILGLNVPQLSHCQPDIYIQINFFPLLRFLVMMHVIRIASMIQIVIQIC
jgi:hypothetical protein